MPADPVRELMAVHQALCERAGHPLEIAAGLEEAGISAATAGRYRHGDVFSLAEEMFARVPRKPADGPSDSGPGPAPAPVADSPSPGRLYRLGYGLGLLGALAASLVVPSGARAAALALTVAAGVAAGPAEWSARWFRRAGQTRLRTAASVADFRARMRPVLPVALGLHLAVLAMVSFAALAVLTVVAPRPGPAVAGGLLHVVLQRAGAAQCCAQAALGLLVALAAVLRRCGQPVAALTGLLAGAASSAAAVALRAGGLLSGRAAAPGAPAALALGAVVVLLMPYAWVVLGRPGAHR